MSHCTVWVRYDQHSGKVQVIYFGTITRNTKGKKSSGKGEKGWRSKKNQLISSSSLFCSPHHGGIRHKQAILEGLGIVGGDAHEEKEGGLLSSDLSRLEVGNKVFDCLVFEEGAYITGEGAICMSLLGSTKKHRHRPLDIWLFYTIIWNIWVNYKGAFLFEVPYIYTLVLLNVRFYIYKYKRSTH